MTLLQHMPKTGLIIWLQVVMATWSTAALTTMERISHTLTCQLQKLRPEWFQIGCRNQQCMTPPLTCALEVMAICHVPTLLKCFGKPRQQLDVQLPPAQIHLAETHNTTALVNTTPLETATAWTTQILDVKFVLFFFSCKIIITLLFLRAKEEEKVVQNFEKELF